MKLTERIAGLCGGLCCLLGLLTMIGWHVGNVALVQVYSVFAPMQYNTALGFVLCGAGLLALVLEEYRLARVCGALAGILSLATLFQYGFRLDFGIDTLFFEPWTMVHTSHGGRMAPNTALGFLLAGCVLVLAAWNRRRFHYPALLVGLAVVVLTIGLTALVGYLTTYSASYAWWNLTRMAVHTSLGFVLFGGGFLFLVYEQSVSGSQKMLRWPPFVLGLLVLSTSFVLWQALLQREGMALRQLGFEAAQAQGLLIRLPTTGLLLGIILTVLVTAVAYYAQLAAVRSRQFEQRVTERTKDLERANARIEKRDVRLHALLNATAEGIFGIDMHGRCTFANAACARLLGYPDAGVLYGCDMHLLMHHSYPDGRPYPKHACDMLRAGTADQGRHRSDEVFWRADGSSFPVEYWSFPVQYPDGSSGYVVSFLDSSERVQAQQEIRRLHASLEQRVRQRTAELEAVNAELEAFAYTVSHDLRAPLRAVEGFAAILMEDYKEQLDENGQELLTSLQKSAWKMETLIDDLLAFSRLGRVELLMTEVAMEELVRRVWQELGSSHDTERIEFFLAELPTVNGDLSMLRQLWVNLLSNAIKFSRNRERPRIEVGCYTNGKSGDATVYYVKDNGVGFEMEYYDQLFRVFQRLHRQDQFEGTGVGLALVERIVTRHEGRVWAEGKPDHGASFFFTLWGE